MVKATGAGRAGSAETDADEVAEPDGPRAASGLPGGSDSLPLTPLQAGMVYETVLSNRPSVNCEQIVIRMAGDAGDLAAMTEAWRGLSRRHPALRMAIDWPGAEGPRQYPQPDTVIAPEFIDLSLLADPEAAFARWRDEDRARGADVRSGLGAGQRLHLLRLGAADSALVWTFPHALLDGRSFAILLGEVFADYEALIAVRPLPAHPQAPDVGVHYRAAAQPAAPESSSFFTAAFDGFEVANEISGAAGQAEAAGQPGGRRLLRLDLPAGPTAALAALAGTCGATLYTALNAAWGLVLSRASGRELAVFGSTRSCRNLVPGGAGMVGCLINTVPLALRVIPGESVGALLARLRADQLAVRAHEHVALSEIQSGLVQAGLAQGGQPLFHSMLICERDTLEDRMRRLGGAWQGRRVELHEEGALPLTLACYGTESLQLHLEYDPAHVPLAAAQRYLDWFAHLLQAMAGAAAETPVAALSMLAPDETALLARNAADPRAPLRAAQPVEAEIAARAAEQPDRPAVIGAEGQALSYTGLEQEAEALARHLRARGVGPGRIVALCLPRTALFPMAVLAVWKAGGAFLPLDPAWPEDRLGYMLEDSGAMLLLTAEGTPDLQAAAVLRLDRPLPAAPDAAAAAPAAQPEDPAYVIYTSGTTGRPKGVVVPRRAIAAHGVAARDWLGLTGADRVLQFTSLSFDVSLEEILPTLLAGASLYLRPEAAGQDPRLLLDHVAQHGITVLNLPTGYWQAMLDDLEMRGAALPASLRLVIAGGERVPPAALARWRRLVPDRAWMNGYGPTETTITAAAFALPPGAELPQGEIPVGRPLSHARLYVLAPDGSLAPPLCQGELWIGGDCVASGYLGQPGLSAERFHPDPFAGAGMMYRSGDLARWREDGQLGLGGRADRQVKLRGYRIEPAEIERLIEGLPGVEQALVSVLDAGLPEARLVAWVRTALPESERGALEQALAGLLPAPMRPALMLLREWPMRPGGKIDLARLPRPARSGEAAGAVGAADPATDPLVQEIAGHFAALLGGAQIGPDTDFFAAGGHSLLLIRLIGRIEAAKGIRLSVTDLHTNPTPRALAALLNSSGPTRRSIRDCIVPIQPHGTRPPIYGVHVLGPNGSFFRPLAQEMGEDQPIFGLTVGLLDEFTPTKIEQTAELYHRVLDEHQPEGPLSLIAISLSSYYALELAMRLLAAGRDVRMLVLLDAEGPDGRPFVGPRDRLDIHLRMLRRDGLSYPLRRARKKLADLRHRIERLKLDLNRRLGRADSPAQTVARFIAANEEAAQSYRPQSFPGRLTIIRAGESTFDSPRALETGLGWASVAVGGFDLHDVPGDHLTILQTPGVADLAAILRRILEEREAEAG